MRIRRCNQRLCAVAVVIAGGMILGELVSQTEVEIKNPNGLHMRPAMQFVDLASQFDSEIKVSNDQMSVDGKSIMQITMLAATAGTKLTIRAEGPDAAEAVKSLKELVEEKLVGETVADAGGEKDV